MTDLDRLANEHASERAILDRRIEPYLELIRWLAAKWADNNPEFPDRDPLTGQRLEGNERLARTWYEVVRGGWRCPECLGSGVHYLTTSDAGVVHLERCSTCDGLGFTQSPPSGDEERPGGTPRAHN